MSGNAGLYQTQAFYLLVPLSFHQGGPHLRIYITYSFSFSHASEVTLLPCTFYLLPANSRFLIEPIPDFFLMEEELVLDHQLLGELELFAFLRSQPILAALLQIPAPSQFLNF